MYLLTIRNAIRSLALVNAILIITTMSVSATHPAQEELLLAEEEECIPLVMEPENVPESVYYIMKGEKSSPASFSWVENGIAGKALQLDGESQHIRLATARVKTLSAFTFSAWVNWAGNENEKEQRLLCLYKNKNHSLIVSPHNTDTSQQLDGIQLTIEDPQIEPVSLYHKVGENVKSALQTHEWHHIAVTLSDEAVALYIDGTPYASQTLENFSVDTMDPYRLVIGSEFEGDAQFKGLIDNALLYTTVLDEDQIALLAQNKKPQEGIKPTTQKEVLATKPYIGDTSIVDETPVRILGLSPVLLAVLGACVVLVIILSLVLSLYRKTNQQWLEEDHP